MENITDRKSEKGKRTETEKMTGKLWTRDVSNTR